MDIYNKGKPWHIKSSFGIHIFTNAVHAKANGRLMRPRTLNI